MRWIALRLIKYEPERESDGNSSNPSSENNDGEWAVIKPPAVKVAAIGETKIHHNFINYLSSTVFLAFNSQHIWK